VTSRIRFRVDTSLDAEKAFPVVIELLGLAVTLHADGSAEGDADALSQRMKDINWKQAGDGMSLPLLWLVLNQIRASAPKEAT